MKEPIIQEVRAVREKLAARFNFNVKSICENARKNQKKSGHPVVSFAGKKILFVLKREFKSRKQIEFCS